MFFVLKYKSIFLPRDATTLGRGYATVSRLSVRPSG